MTKAKMTVAEDAIRILSEAGVTSEMLDEVVHEVYAEIAAGVNNGGIQSQIMCLWGLNWSLQDIINHYKEKR